MLKRDFSLKERILLIILAVLLLVALYVFAVQQPVSNGIANAESEITETETNIQILQGKLKKMNDMKAELVELKNNKNVQEVPDYDNLPEVITFLNTVLGGAKDYQISLSTEFPGDGGEVMRRTAQVSYQCENYRLAKESVKRLEACNYMDRVSNLVISPVNSEGSDLMNNPVRVSMTITFFERVA